MKYRLLFFSIVLLLAACGKEGPVGPKGPVGVSYTWPPSEINGYAFLWSQYGTPLATSDSVLVRTYNGQYWFSTYTDKRGFWQLRKMPPGNYDISFTKPGYDSMHIYIKHAGGDEPKFVGDDTLFASLDMKITSLDWQLSATSTTLVGVSATIHYTGGVDEVYTRPVINVTLVYVAPDSSVYSIYNVENAAVFDPAFTPGTVHISLGLNRANVPAGGTVYLVAGQRRPSGLPVMSWYNYATSTWVKYPYPAAATQSDVKQWPAAS